jgi:hypothetical protein
MGVDFGGTKIVKWGLGGKCGEGFFTGYRHRDRTQRRKLPKTSGGGSFSFRGLAASDDISYL